MSALNHNNPPVTKIGVIDLGTNTFHLLIVSQQGADWREEFRVRKFVELGEEGIRTIGEKALARGYDALVSFMQILAEHKVGIVQANGTAALRTATNGPAYLVKIKSELGLDVELIDGRREAELIYAGVKQAIPRMDEPSLIMDIGGGSVEFIIGDKNQIFWAQSFPIGVAVLFNKFHKSDPISSAEIQAMYDYLNELLIPLKKELAKHPCQFLVGSSGTFDVLEKILPATNITPNSASIDIAAYPPLFERFVSSRLEERLAWADVPQQRARLIVVALVLINKILEFQPFPQILVSRYAMKEGMIAQFLPKS